MSQTFSGHRALICPDCGNHLINRASQGERYHCADCDLRIQRESDSFSLSREGQTVGLVAIEEVGVQVIWRFHDLASAV